jgi:hypothetical protein
MQTRSGAGPVLSSSAHRVSDRCVGCDLTRVETCVAGTQLAEPLPTAVTQTAVASCQAEELGVSDRGANTSPPPVTNASAQTHVDVATVCIGTDALPQKNAGSQAVPSGAAAASQTDAVALVPLAEVKALEERHRAELAAARRELEESRGRYAELERGFANLQRALHRTLAQGSPPPQPDHRELRSLAFASSLAAAVPSGAGSGRSHGAPHPTGRRQSEEESATAAAAAGWSPEASPSFDALWREQPSQSPRRLRADGAAAAGSLEALLSECDLVTSALRGPTR